MKNKLGNKEDLIIYNEEGVIFEMVVLTKTLAIITKTL